MKRGRFLLGTIAIMDDSFLSPRLRGLQPYVPGEQPQIEGLVKLNTNENAYPPSARVRAAIIEAASHGLERYPDPESRALRRAIAHHHEVDPSQVFVGNGSDEVLGHAFAAFFQHAPARLLLPDVTYGFYAVYCQLYDIPALPVPVDAGLQVDVEAFAQAAAQPEGCAGIVLANPNAPTGQGLGADQLRTLLAIAPARVVLVDEAYVDFGGESAVDLVAEHPNLLVVQTLSKSRALAGLRVGWAVGQPELIELLTRVKNSFNAYPLGWLAQQGAIAALQDQAHFEQTRRAVMRTRECLAEGLRERGFEVLPSLANFLFARHPARDAGELAAQLRQARILVRHFRQPRIAQYLRISIGTDAQTDYLLHALDGLLTPAAVTPDTASG